MTMSCPADLLHLSFREGLLSLHLSLELLFAFSVIPRLVLSSDILVQPRTQAGTLPLVSKDGDYPNLIHILGNFQGLHLVIVFSCP